MTTPVKFLEGAAIYLRPRQLDDADWLYQSLNNDGEDRRLGGPRWLRPASRSSRTFSSWPKNRAVVRQDDKVLVGGVVLDQIDGRLRSADFHMFIDGDVYQARLWHRGHTHHVKVRLRDIEHHARLAPVAKLPQNRLKRW